MNFQPWKFMSKMGLSAKTADWKLPNVNKSEKIIPFYPGDGNTR